MNLFTHMHAMVVHFPIALLFVSVVVELCALNPKWRNSLQPVAAVTLILGTIGAAVAVATGPDHDARGVTQLIHSHQNWAQLTLIWFSALSLWRLFILWRKKAFAGTTAVAFVLLGVIGLGMLSYTGYLGGQMTYDEAIGVSRNGVRIAPPKPFQRRPGQQGGEAPGQ